MLFDEVKCEMCGEVCEIVMNGRRSWITELKMIVVAKIYEALTLSDVISVGTRPACVDGQCTGSSL